MFIERLEKLCEERGVSLYRICKDTGISTANMSQWKKGLSSPNLKSLRKLADYFGVPLEYLVGASSRAPQPSTDHSHYVPVLGRVAAGIPIEMVEDVLGFEEVDDSVGEAFALVIDGGLHGAAAAAGRCGHRAPPG